MLLKRILLNSLFLGCSTKPQSQQFRKVRLFSVSGLGRGTVSCFIFESLELKNSGFFQFCFYRY